MAPRAPLTSSKESNLLEPGSLRRYAPILRRKALLRAREKSLSDCSWGSISLSNGPIYSPLAPPTRARDNLHLHFEDAVAVDVDDLGRSLLYDPFLIRSVKVYVPVQPQGRLVRVDEIHKR